jgi:hypothetical protein
VRPGPAPAATGCPEGVEEAALAAPSATRRAEAALAVLRGCERGEVARRYGATPEVLEAWTHDFVRGGRGALLSTAPARPEDLQAAWRGTWVLRSRLARGQTPAQVEGVMVVGDDEALTVETGVLSDDFSELPLGPQAGQPFRLGQYSRLQYVQRDGSRYVVRLSSSELLGSFSDFPRGIRASLVEPFVRRGEAFVHSPSPVRSYSPTSSDEMVLLGDRLLIGWSKLDVVDTWERVGPRPAGAADARPLHETWERLRRSRALLEKQPARAAELLGLTAGVPAAVAAPAQSR